MYFSRYIAIIYMVFLNVSRYGCTQLFMNDSNIIEYMSVNLTCTSSESSTYSAWYAGNNTFYVGYDSTNGTCITHAGDDMVERCYVNDNSTYTVTISPRRDQHGQTWSCRIRGLTSNPIVLYVSVPVYNVTLGSPSSAIVLKEDIVSNVSCITSYSRPRANITWYMYIVSSDSVSTPVYFNEAYNTCSNTPDSTDDSLVSTTCTVAMLMNRTHNGWNLVCAAENINHYRPVATGSITIIVTYPTNKPIIQCTNNGIYRVVENTQGNLTCSADGGNPAGTLHWNCTGDITDYRGTQNSVTQTLVWNATQPLYCTCTSTNIAGNQSTSVKTEVLYPPIIGAMENISVFEGDNLSLQCEITQANPPVNLIQWSSNRYNVSGTTLTKLSISRTDDTIYTCTAYNTMNPSCRDVVYGNTSKSIHIDVLYPPTIDIPQGKTFTIKEGDIFNYTCVVVAGNPTNTNITWTSSNDARTWNSSQLLIHNVTRYDDLVYTCYVSNVMINSEGVTRIGNGSAFIRLVVKFKANVIDFFIQSYGHTSNVIVNESVSLTFVCHLEGNPTADTRIYETDRLVKSSNANVLSYHTTSTCTGGPVIYRCEGSNLLNNIPSTRDIELLVHCKPRRDMKSVDNLIVTSAINQTVTLTYTALAYPHPTFVWYRNGSTIDSNNQHFVVSTSNLTTRLTISNVKESDYGIYILHVTNRVGSVIEVYTLKQHEPRPLRKTTSTSSSPVIPAIGGSIAVLVIVGVICLIVFFLRRRRCLKPTSKDILNNQQNSSPGVSSTPVTYENLKMEQIPNTCIPIEYHREHGNGKTSESDVDHTYQGLSRNDNDVAKDEYSNLGGNNDTNAKVTYENLKIQT